MTGTATSPNGPDDWREAARYRALHGIDRAGLMWEWLRRDEGYVSWFAQAGAARGAGLRTIESWGLHFR